MNIKNKSIKRSENGITLIAIVVTIIVLLVLASVTVVTLFGESGIITKAQKASKETKDSADKEIEGLENLTNEKKWENVKNEKGQIKAVKIGNQEIKIGAYVTYDCTNGGKETASYTCYSYDNRDKNNGITSGYSEDQTFNAKEYTGKWRVLGANENGELELMATSNVIGENGNEFILGPKSVGTGWYGGKGMIAYQYGVTELNNISAIYGKGKGATGARSIKVEDVNNITGYNPERTGNIDNNPYGKDSIAEYGNKFTYYWDGTVYPYYEYITKAGEKKTGKTSGTTGKYEYRFTWNDNGESKISEKPTDLTSQVTEVSQMKKINENPIVNNNYTYLPESLKNVKGANVGIVRGTPEYDMLFGNNDSQYWLGSETNYANVGSSTFCLRCVSLGSVTAKGLFTTKGNEYEVKSGVRPVVSISTIAKLTGQGENIGTEENPYKIEI